MSIHVNPPEQLRIPSRFDDDPDARSFFEKQQKILFQLWQRTGGGPGHRAVINTSSDLVLDNSHYGALIVVDATSAVQITLPPIAQDVIGESIEITVSDATSDTTVIPASGTISGDSSVVIYTKDIISRFTVDTSTSWVWVNNQNTYIKLSDVKSSGVSGGTSSAGNNIRTLNTKSFDAGGNCTLDGGFLKFTLLAGTYRISASVPAYRAGRHQAVLYNITDSAVEITGTAERSETGGTQTRSFMQDEFTIASSKEFRIDHWFESGVASTGLGIGAGAGYVNLYTVVELWKL